MRSCNLVDVRGLELGKNNKKGLTPKQERFIQEYLIDLNATQAAIRAGYSQKTAHPMGAENLRKPTIAAAITKAQLERAKRTEITQDRVLEEYAKLAFLNPKHFYDDKGQLIPIHELPDEVAAALTGMDITTAYNKENETFDTIKKIKYSDKKGALDSLAKHLGMFIERLAVTDTEGKDVLTHLLEDIKGVTRGLPNRSQRKIRE